MAKEGANVNAREAELNALREENAKIKAEADEKYQKQQAQIEALMAMMSEKNLVVANQKKLKHLNKLL
jgi:hypothetical protein